MEDKKQVEMPESIYEKLRSILRLSQDPAAPQGEKIAAQNALNRLLEKYQITLEDLLEEKKDIFWFRYDDRHMMLVLEQCVDRIVSPFNGEYVESWSRPHSRMKGFYITPTAAKEVEIFYEHYKKAWRDDLERFKLAFIHRNDLFSHNRVSEGKSTLSQEEIDAIVAMMRGLNHHGNPLNPRLEG